MRYGGSGEGVYGGYGRILFNPIFTGTVTVGDAGSQALLTTDGAEQLAQRNGTTAQRYHLYNTWTSASNFERLNIAWSGNNLYLQTAKGGGGGSSRHMIVDAAGILYLAGGNLATGAWHITPLGAMNGATRFSVGQGAAVASAAEVTLGSDGNRFQISGTTQIDKILSTGWQGGSTITLHFQGNVAVTHDTAANGAFHGIMLAGASTFNATANDQLTLQYDSTAAKWYEIARTVI